MAHTYVWDVARMQSGGSGNDFPGLHPGYRSIQGAGQLDQFGAPFDGRRQGEEGWVEQGFTRFIGQHFALEGQHFAAGAFQHTLCGSGVPLRGRRQARVAIGNAFGQLAELQRATDAG